MNNYLKTWTLTLESRASQLREGDSINSNFIKFTPIQNTLIDLTGTHITDNPVNRKLTEEEFDRLVAGLKEYYFNNDDYEEFKC